VRPLSPVAAGRSNFPLNIKYGNTWADNSGLGVSLLWDVTHVQVDQVPAEISLVNRFGNNWNATVEGNWTPGKHQVSVIVECAYVDSSRLMGANLDKLPAAQWPKSQKRWTTTVTLPLKVVPVAQQ
jgi:hypothetical protein